MSASMTPDQVSAMMEEMTRLKMENESLKKVKGEKPLTMKVSEKGAVSVYGLNRFPVTLYKQQWVKLLEISEEIKEFIATNDDALVEK